MTNQEKIKFAKKLNDSAKRFFKKEKDDVSMFQQEAPVGEKCDECGEIIEQSGNMIYCPNGCFEDDIRNFYSFNYR